MEVPRKTYKKSKRRLKEINLKRNTEKTRTIIIANENLTHNVNIEGQDIEHVGILNSWVESSTVKAP